MAKIYVTDIENLLNNYSFEGDGKTYIFGKIYKVVRDFLIENEINPLADFNIDTIHADRRIPTLSLRTYGLSYNPEVFTIKWKCKKVTSGYMYGCSGYIPYNFEVTIAYTSLFDTSCDIASMIHKLKEKDALSKEKAKNDRKLGYEEMKKRIEEAIPYDEFIKLMFDIAKSPNGYDVLNPLVDWHSEFNCEYSLNSAIKKAYRNKDTFASEVKGV